VIELDGSHGEGGGQVLRSALALSLVTGQPFRLKRIRANRSRPGLRPQHLAAVRAAAAVGAATLEGAEVGSSELVFEPSDLVAGDHFLDIGTAGSTTLVAQTVLVPLALAGGRSRIRIRGGTHNPMAPTTEFLERVCLPMVARVGIQARLEVVRRGFYPPGGGEIVLEVEPATDAQPLELLERGRVRRRHACALVARLPESIAQRELDVVARRLGWQRREMEIVVDEDAPSPGNYLVLEVECEHATEVCSAIGQMRLPAEKVATAAARELRTFLDADVPVGEHGADQLMLPLAVRAGGSFRTLLLSSHATTQLETMRAFLDLDVAVEAEAAPGSGGAVRVHLHPR
jgi:RNA 3'-terminal phosphate cyclase (ATP)